MNCCGRILCLFGLTVIACSLLGCSGRTAGPRQTPKKEQASGVADRVAASHQPADAHLAEQSSPDPHWLASIPAPFVGSSKCAQCHPERASEYAETTHARALRIATTKKEAVGKEVYHQASGQRHQVVEVDGALHHRGWQERPTGLKLPLADVEIQCVMGSGSAAKSYLFRDGSSWLQAPLTYYTTTGSYDMSPGYDRPSHSGFTREITDQCMFCHAGFVTREGENQNHFAIHEMSIGCERCHGAGGDHVELAEAQADSATAGKAVVSDWQILHPGQLDRTRLESICAQCHLQGDITLFAGQNDSWTFRPGEVLGQRFIIYRFSSGPVADRLSDKEEDRTAFVGHFEQLRRSACYQGDQTLTCVTCHDPHRHDEPDQMEKTQRSHCLSCHANEHCHVPMPERVDVNNNRCWSCHMPRRKTEVPHVAISNHRIAVYSGETGPDSNSDDPTERTANQPAMLPVAVALLDLAPDGSWQRELNAAVATAAWLREKAGDEFRTPAVLDLAIAQLQDAIERMPANLGVAGQPDSVATVVSRNMTRAHLMGLLDARLWQSDVQADEERRAQIQSQIRSLAQSIRTTEPGATPAYQLALELLASIANRTGKYDDAYRWYSELIRMRRFSADHYNFGLACVRMRKYGEAEGHFYEALRIQGDYAKPYSLLARLYQSIDPQRAARLARLAQQLQYSRSASSADGDRGGGAK